MRRWIQISLLALAAMLCALSLGSLAQQLKAGGKRKIVVQAPLAYPPLARKMNLIGTVRLSAAVAPSGKVLRIDVLGGSPVLVQSASDAVSKFKWEAGPNETKEVVEIKFQPDME